MSEAVSAEAFEAARDDAHEDEADLAAPEGDEDDAPPAKDWQKIAQDKEAALAAERTRRKSEARARRDLEERMAKIEAERGSGNADPLAELVKSLREDGDDPMDDIDKLKKFLKTYMADQAQQRDQEGQQSQQQRAVQQIVGAMSDSEADFAADHPDYHDAAKHYRTEREAELKELGYSGQQLQTALTQDLIGLVDRAIKGGRDPAEVVYGLAKRRGFSADTEADAARKKLDVLADGARSGARPQGGQGRTGPLSYSDVTKLKGAARDAAFAKLREQERKAG